jgi:hypothetical protein
MRQKLITLDPTSWDLATKKTNFSEWVRNQLRAERNKEPQHVNMRLQDMSTERIEWELKKRMNDECDVKNKKRWIGEEE